MKRLYIRSMFSCKLGVSLLCGVGLDSSVGIATRYRLVSPGIKSWWGPRFSALVQTGPGAHPASHTMGTRSFPGVSGQGMALTTNLHLTLRLKKE